MIIFPDFVGKSVSGLDGEAAAQRLRGRVGTTVKVKLLDVFPYLEPFILIIRSFLFLGMKHKHQFNFKH